MLVLSRKVGQEIVIDGHTTVRVISCDGGRVRLGISAPKSVKVNRREVEDAQDVVVVVLRPTSIHETISEQIEALAGTTKRLILDVSAVEVLCSEGIGSILGLHRRCEEAGGQLLLRNVTPFSQDVIRVCNLGGVLHFE